jgi:hypothetical protein
MSVPSIYRMTQPTGWAAAPTSYSYSSLTSIERCPRQWQLEHSSYNELPRFPARPNPATAEGDIVHRVLDKLFRSLAIRGLPSLGSDEFRKCLVDVDIRGSVNTLIQEHEQRLVEHPRGARCRLKAGNQQLVNKIIRLFRAQYEPAPGSAVAAPSPTSLSTGEIPSGQALYEFLVEYGTLSELPLSHPALPFSGILDLLRMTDEGVIVTDFKTGQVRDDHLKQVRLYAVLWWRCSHHLPARCQVRYPGETREVGVTESELVAVERELGNRIEAAREALSKPWSEAKTGDHCTYCDVRQFCKPFWDERANGLPRRAPTNNQPQWVDVELTVASDPSENGFEAETPDGTRLLVVFQQSDTPLHGPFQAGERLRILRGMFKKKEGEFELKPWTEVFHVSGTDGE